ncbi:hypothetical protein [Streptomyces sp. NPDC049881]|uniref:hypothetical protein n=1 Tax=Streptomyces sp. NPDC049881 TaxID=3155778 RepID=UPI0034235811
MNPPSPTPDAPAPTPVRERWASQPRPVRWALIAYLAGFAQGTAAHVLDIATGGIHTYAGLGPPAMQAFYLSLVVLDPLVVLLVSRVRPPGIVLAATVMAADVTANWITNWPMLRDDPTWFLRPVGLLPITLFGLFVTATAIPLHRSVAASAPPPR